MYEVFDTASALHEMGGPQAGHSGRWSWSKFAMQKLDAEAASALSPAPGSNVIVLWSSPGPRAGQADTHCLLPAGVPTAARLHCIHVTDTSAARTRHDQPCHVPDESCAAVSTRSSHSSLLQMLTRPPHTLAQVGQPKMKKSAGRDYDLVRSRTFGCAPPAHPVPSVRCACACPRARVWRARPPF